LFLRRPNNPHVSCIGLDELVAVATNLVDMVGTLPVGIECVVFDVGDTLVDETGLWAGTPRRRVFRLSR
jgi:hypothetical protein